MIIIMVIDTIKKVIETYSNVYFPDINNIRSKEKFKYDYDYDDSCNGYSCSYYIIMALVSWLITGFAVYLSFKCSNGFSIGPFLLALLFSPFYIIYHIFDSKLCGIMN
jgi:hypothetical protein